MNRVKDEFPDVTSICERLVPAGEEFDHIPLCIPQSSILQVRPNNNHRITGHVKWFNAHAAARGVSDRSLPKTAAPRRAVRCAV